MKNFVLIGAGGYIAPKHLSAIKNVGGNLVAALDKNDSVGVLDSYFPEASFFTEFERFDRHLEKLQYKHGTKIDYVSICSPNYLHDAHIRFALRIGANAICEKPLVINPWNLDHLQEMEETYNGKIYTVLQLRYSETYKKLQEMAMNADEPLNIDLTYVTSRGKWYDVSWKGDESKSGGLACNIGIHFFDVLCSLFGDVTNNYVGEYSNRRAAGKLIMKNARVRWRLSVNKEDVPSHSDNPNSYRSIRVNGDELNLSGKFQELHTDVYKDIMSGGGYGVKDARPSIELVHDIRNTFLTPTFEF